MSKLAVMLKLNKNSSVHKETLMEETQIVTDYLDEEASHLSKSTQIVIDYLDEEAAHLSKSMQRKLDTLWGQPNEIEKFTIFRAPCHIRESDKDLFEPLAVSIGPFHRHNTRVQAMEEKKWLFLRDFLSRGNHISLDLCILEMKLLEERTRRCYSETVNIDSNGFVEMMLLDGCFVLEYFLEMKEDRFNSISEVGWNCVFIDSDLLLLENQISFFVVEKLCEIGVKEENVINFIIESVVTDSINRGLKCKSLIPNPPAQIHHLVHLCYSQLVPNPGKLVVSSSKSFLLTRVFSSNRIKILLLRFFLWVLRIRFSSSTFSDFTRNVSSSVIPCATQLHDAGIKFRPKANPKHMFDISFVDGVLEIPMLEIAGCFKSFIANLVAYEQCIHERHNHLSSFASFLDSLINTEKDVMILQQCKIIKNGLGSEEELTHFINQVCQGVVLNDNFLAELLKEVNIYCESSWNRHRARLIRDYFSSPWAAISLVAALVLLVLTLVQSFFAVYAYFVPPSS